MPFTWRLRPPMNPSPRWVFRGSRVIYPSVYDVHMDMVARDDVIGLTELADILGTTRQSLCNRLKREFDASPNEPRNGDLPRPFGHVSGNTIPVWDRADVNEYLNLSTVVAK